MRHACSFIALAACAPVQHNTPAPEEFSSAEVVPAQPRDASAPMLAVRWVLNYDVSKLADTRVWLEGQTASDERTRALAALEFVAVFEGQDDARIDACEALLTEAIARFPEDGRLRAWIAFLRFHRARKAGDIPARDVAIDEMRAANAEYPAFNPFAMGLAIGSLEGASPELLEETLNAMKDALSASSDLQFGDDQTSVQQTRRVFADTPIAPFNIPGTLALVADLALRTGDKNLAARDYYTAMLSNWAYKWPWRAEVQRRMENMDAMAAGMNAVPATEFALGSRQAGSCSLCHSHRTAFDGAPSIGWIRGRYRVEGAIKTPNPIFFALLEASQKARPDGFAIGAPLSFSAPADFDRDDALYDGEFLIQAPPGLYFVAAQVGGGDRGVLKDMLFTGYTAQGPDIPRFTTVKAGEVSDISHDVMVLKKAR